MIRFKYDYLREEFHKLDQRIKDVVNVIDALMVGMHGIRAVITSVYRDIERSPHKYYRAVDISTLGLTHEECVFLGNIVSMIFPYKKNGFNTMIYHNVGQGWHFHVQVKA